MPLTTFAADPLLDLPVYRGQRTSTFRFRHINSTTGLHLGDVTPVSNTVPSITHDTSRLVSRQLSFTFSVEDTLRTNAITSRIEPLMVLSDGREFPLGRFMFTNVTKIPSTGGVTSATTLVDEMFIIDQPLETSFSTLLSSSNLVTSVSDAIMRLLTGLPIEYDLEPSPFQMQNSWFAGTSRAKVLTDLSVQGGYFNPWFDNNAVLQIRQAFDPATQIPNFDFDDPPRVYRDSIAEENDLLDAPNKFIVISNSGQETVPFVGEYEIPNSAPHSIQNRGFVVPLVQQMQLASAAQAAGVARSIGLQSTVFEKVTLNTPPDPRHDGYNIVRWDGHLWLETAWTLPLIEGGQMQHSLRRTYS